MSKNSKKKNHKFKWHGKKTKEEVHSGIKYLRTSGTVGLLSSVGAILIPSYYWWFIAFTYIGFILLAIDIYYEFNDRTAPKVIGISVLVILSALFSLGFVFTKAPLGIIVSAYEGNHEEGKIIGDISWEPNYSEMRILITNRSLMDYEGFDLEFTTDSRVVKLGQISDISNVAFSSQMDTLNPRITSIDEDGKKHEHLFSVRATSGLPHRIRVEKLPSNYTLQLVVALIGKENNETSDPKKRPKWACIRGDYMARYKPFSIDYCTDDLYSN